jgi:hypothetical protein
MPSSSAYRARFGSLLRAYGLVGFTPRRDYRYIEINRALRQFHPSVVADVLEGLRRAGSVVQLDGGTDLIRVNGEFALSVVIARCQRNASGSLRWQIRLDMGLQPDITAAIRMDAGNRAPFDFYLFPHIDNLGRRLRLAEDNGLGIDAYRFETLDVLYDLSAPVRIVEAA